MVETLLQYIKKKNSSSTALLLNLETAKGFLFSFNKTTFF